MWDQGAVKREKPGFFPQVFHKKKGADSLDILFKIQYNMPHLG